MNRRFGIGRRHLRGFGGGGAGPTGDPTYVASGFSDANYFAGVAGEGARTFGTARVLVRVNSLPPSSTRAFVSYCDGSGAADGYYFATGLGVAGGIGGSLAGLAGGLVSDIFIMTADDVGSLLLLHWAVDATSQRMHVGGIQVGTGVATGSLFTQANIIRQFRIGRFPTAGFSNPNIDIVAFAATPTVMTLPEIAADAATIMARTSRLDIPDLPGQVVNYNAADIVSATNWVDRAGNDATLTRNGTVTVTEVT